MSHPLSCPATTPQWIDVSIIAWVMLLLVVVLLNPIIGRDDQRTRPDHDVVILRWRLGKLPFYFIRLCSNVSVARNVDRDIIIPEYLVLHWPCRHAPRNIPGQLSDQYNRCNKYVNGTTLDRCHRKEDHLLTVCAFIWHFPKLVGVATLQQRWWLKVRYWQKFVVETLRLFGLTKGEGVLSNWRTHKGLLYLWRQSY